MTDKKRSPPTIETVGAIAFLTQNQWILEHRRTKIIRTDNPGIHTHQFRQNIRTQSNLSLAVDGSDGELLETHAAVEDNNILTAGKIGDGIWAVTRDEDEAIAPIAPRQQVGTLCPDEDIVTIAAGEFVVTRKGRELESRVFLKHG
ncbi:MAG: hypothetical protein ACP5D7_08275 [Limnospira sp.]